MAAHSPIGDFFLFGNHNLYVYPPLCALAKRHRYGPSCRGLSHGEYGGAPAPPHIHSLHSGRVPHPVGNSHPSISPYDLIPTADRPVYLTIGNDRQSSRMTEPIGRPEFSFDPRFR